MEKKHKFSLWYVLLGVWLVLLLHNMIASALMVETIPYSEFIKHLKEGKVTEIAISENDIQGRMITSADSSDKGTLFRTVRVDPDIARLLDENDVTYSGRIESNFLGTVMSWVIPIALFFGIWILMMRRFQQQSGFMTIGKNKAKIYMEDDVPVRFADAAGVDEARQELAEVTSFLKEPERYTRVGGQIPRGILLVGPPGTGKTLLAKAVAGESGGAIFQPERFGIRRDVRRLRCRARQGSLQGSQSEGALHHFYRRTGCPGKGPGDRHGRWS
jgi:cell division protease FtsH